jgi:hypothetical protein
MGEFEKMEKRGGIVDIVIDGGNRLDIPSKKLYTSPDETQFH